MREDDTQNLPPSDEQLVVQVAGRLYAQMTGGDLSLPAQICHEVALEALGRAEIFVQAVQERRAEEKEPYSAALAS